MCVCVSARKRKYCSACVLVSSLVAYSFFFCNGIVALLCHHSRHCVVDDVFVVAAIAATATAAVDLDSYLSSTATNYLYTNTGTRFVYINKKNRRKKTKYAHNLNAPVN